MKTKSTKLLNAFFVFALICMTSAFSQSVKSSSISEETFTPNGEIKKIEFANFVRIATKGEALPHYKCPRYIYLDGLGKYEISTAPDTFEMNYFLKDIKDMNTYNILFLPYKDNTELLVEIRGKRNIWKEARYKKISD